MSVIKKARPVKSPERAKSVISANKKSAKKTVARNAIKKVVVRKPVANERAPAKPKSGKPAVPSTSAVEPKISASVRARRRTIDTTLCFPGEGDLVIDPSDDAANQKFKRIRRTTAVDKLNHSPATAGATLIERVSNAVERELLQIETIVGGHRVQQGQRTEAERRARTLASLARTLTEIRRLRAAEEPQRPPDGPSAARDLDAFRRILWKRLEGLAGRTTPYPPDVDEHGGNT